MIPEFLKLNSRIDENVPILLLRELRNLCWLVKTDENKSPGVNFDWVRGPPCNSKYCLYSISTTEEPSELYCILYYTSVDAF